MAASSTVPPPPQRQLLRRFPPTRLRLVPIRVAGSDERLEFASAELRAAAAQSMDWAPARRTARATLVPVLPTLPHCLFQMSDGGIRTEERYERNSKGMEIFWKSWLPRQGIPIKAALFFCHGYGDTCTFFFEGIAKIIAAAGYAVYAMDYPGFGLSYGLHGYVPSFDGLVDHVIEQYTRIKDEESVNGLPVFLLGQSMGGAVALKIHLKQPRDWDGLILVAPMCKIAEEVMPSTPVLTALNLLSYLLPEAKLFPMKDLGELSFRDQRKRKIAEYNVISYQGKMRLKTAIELIKAAKEIELQLEKVSCPLLILHGAADKVTDPRVSKFLYGKANTRDKTLRLYEESYHCILEGEPDDRMLAAIGDIVSWMNSHLTSHLF